MYVAAMRSVMDSEPFVVTTSLAVVLVTLVALYLVMERRKLPPGPVAWTVVGSFPAIYGALPHRSLRALAAKYGDLMFLRLGSVPTLVVSIAEELFRHHDANILKRPQSMSFDEMTDNGKNIFLANGSYWRQLLKICIFELFTMKRQASYQRVRTEEIQTRVREIVAAAEQGKPIDVKNWLKRVTTNNMTLMTTNRRFFGDGAESENDIEDLESMMEFIFNSKALGVCLMSDYVPFLRVITKLLGLGKMIKDMQALFDDVTERVFEIEKHRQRAKERRDDENYVPDFVDLLLQTPLKDGETLPDRNINLVLRDMLGAGSETVATTLEWGMAELMLQPKLMARLQSELDAVVGTRRLVQESDIPNLPFLQAVVKETFRLHATVGIPREVTQAFTFRGYKVPKQAQLILNLHAIHRDPDVYEDPDSYESIHPFNPDRFVDRPEVNHLSGFDSYELIPFSAERRMCPAANLANIMATSILAHLVHSFEWRMPDGIVAPDMTEKHGLSTGMKSPLRLLAAPRASAFLY